MSNRVSCFTSHAQDDVPLILRAATVYPDRIELSLQVSHPQYAVSSPTLITALLQTHPYLLEHTCKNDVGTTFGAVAYTTSMPHVFEHLVIDNQMSALADSGLVSDVVLVGTTQWSTSASSLDHTEEGKRPSTGEPKDESKREHEELFATVRVSFIDDVMAFAAINAALKELNELLVTAY